MKIDLSKKIKSKSNKKRISKKVLIISVSVSSLVVVSAVGTGVGIVLSENQNNSSTNNANGNGNNSNVSLPTGYSLKSDTTYDQVRQFSQEYSKNNFFNYPVYGTYNGVETVTLQAIGAPSRNYPEDDQTTGGSPALQNVLKTQKHVQLAKQVYSVGFQNGTEVLGTAWILDYKLTDDGSYPITWYFGTNAHVIDDLKVKNDKLYPEKFGEWDASANNFRSMNTSAINLWQIDNPQVDVTYGNNISGSGTAYWKHTTVSFYNVNPDGSSQSIYYPSWSGYYSDNPPVKTIFQGYDFLTTSPSDTSTNSYSNKQEYADFGVFELTFNSAEQAKEATNGYADWDESLKFKYYQDDLLNNPSLKTEYVYEVGYPQKASGEIASRVISINANATDTFNGGNGLSKSIHYNTFSDFPGAFDGYIGMPWFGYSYEWVDNSKPYGLATTSTAYSTYGLLYATKNGPMEAGSSGALLVDDNGYALGIHFASDNNAAEGTAQAFYSGGYDYQGYYGDYNLPQYDLIRGGYPLQKGSYFDGLVGWYGSDANFKTRLFPNGLTSRN